MIVTIGLLIALNGLTGWIWGAEVKAFDSPFPNGTTEIAGVVISYQDLGVLCVCLATVLRALGVLPLHDARSRHARGREQPGGEPADGCPRRLDARARLGPGRSRSAPSPE